MEDILFIRTGGPKDVITNKEGQPLENTSASYTDEDKEYYLIWEGKRDVHNQAAVYLYNREKQMLTRVDDEDLCSSINYLFWGKILRNENYHTDGPDWYFEQQRDLTMGIQGNGFFSMNMKRPEEWTCPACGSAMKGGKFCGECGRPRPL
ncbi:MAG: hypothetical protein IJ806_08005 [Ruminococcus sp.]|nr:hypothetical protein [Ruminococcus sp.]